MLNIQLKLENLNFVMIRYLEDFVLFVIIRKISYVTYSSERFDINFLDILIF